MKTSPVKQGNKFDIGKLRFDLIPTKPLEALAFVYTIGAKKYGDRNWEKGILYSRIFAAMMRHAITYWSGEKLDPIDHQHHLASVAWGALALMEYEVSHPELDDRPIKLIKKLNKKRKSFRRKNVDSISSRKNRKIRKKAK